MHVVLKGVVHLLANFLFNFNLSEHDQSYIDCEVNETDVSLLEQHPL